MKTKYKINDSFFNTIDTEAKAYFLGLMYADGNIDDTRDYRLRLVLQEPDLHIIEKFKEVLECEHPIFLRNPYKGQVKRQVGLEIYNKKIVQSLIEMGCTPRKSLNMAFPIGKVPSKLLNHFVRGYFDGDGCVFVRKERFQYSIQICVTKEFGQTLQNILGNLEETIRESIYLRKATYSDINILTFNGKAPLVAFGKWIYQDANIFLTRKHSKFQECA